MNSQTNQVFVSQSVNGPFAIDAKAYLTYLIQQGHKARRVVKFSEDEKNTYERNLVAMHTIHRQQSAALINS